MVPANAHAQFCLAVARPFVVPLYDVVRIRSAIPSVCRHTSSSQLTWLHKIPLTPAAELKYPLEPAYNVAEEK
jgi:hypothetical protein